MVDDKIIGNKADLIISDELAKVYETFGTSKKAITNSNVGAIHTADDIMFPDMVPVSNEELEAMIDEQRMYGALDPIPDGGFFISPNFVQALDAKMMEEMENLQQFHEMRRNSWVRPTPKSINRGKVLAKRAKDKANRKRARK